jgi:hypothetical protein
MAPTRTERLQAYVRERLRQEIAAGPRGTAARIGKAANISGAHITNMMDPVRPRGPGLDAIERLARYWGLTIADLQRLVDGAAPTTDDVPWDGLARAMTAAADAYDARDVRAVTALYEGQQDVAPLTWARRLDDMARRREQGLDEVEAERARTERLRRGDTPLDEVLRARPDLQSVASRFDPHGPRPVMGWLEFLLEESKREKAAKRRK